jgi:KTSC domain
MPFSFRNLFGRFGKPSAKPQTLPTEERYDDSLDAREAAFLLGDWLDISSSWIEKAHYDGDTRILEIQISGGAFYQRHMVSENEASDFIRAPSAGTWIWNNGWRAGQFLRLTAVSPPKKR